MMKPAARLLAHFTPMDMEDRAPKFSFSFFCLATILRALGTDIWVLLLTSSRDKDVARQQTLPQFALTVCHYTSSRLRNEH